MDVKNGQNAQAVYLATRVNTASKEQLLLLTYEIGIRACRNAEGALNGGSPEDLNTHVKKAQDVLRELMVTLNRETGGDVAKNLMQLYDFMYFLLVEANIGRDGEKLAVVRSMLEELKTVWEEAAAKLAAEHSALAEPASSLHPKAGQQAAALSGGGLNIAG